MKVIDATSPWWILELCFVTGWGQNGRPIPFERWMFWHKHCLMAGGFAPNAEALGVVQDALRLSTSVPLAA